MSLIREPRFPNMQRVLWKLADRSDFIPERLWKTLFPIFRVRVQTYERQAEAFEDLELFFVRGVGAAGLQTVDELQAFFQLDSGLTTIVVTMLTTRGQISVCNGRLALTPLGWESLQAERRISYLTNEQVLLFEG
ncbi:MAG: hypothetical protein MUD01_20480, partial [Chloroflexaceae bacterium]|nr:hypothetical protein [Chloroflexaceae bacterium]